MPNILDILRMQPATKADPFMIKQGVPAVDLKEYAMNVNSLMPVSGDIQSGVMAAQDLKKGNYGSAALNSIGLLPFIPSLAAITAYHGTPNKIVGGKFDLSKIGTGTGDQNYGKGLYFTESPELAKSYQSSKELNTGDIFINNKKVTPKNIDEELALQGVRGFSFYDVGKDPIDSAINSFKQGLGTYKDEARNIKNKNALDYLTKLKEKNANFISGGNLYKVDIADESIPKMLDFEKPLKEQSNEIKNLAKEYSQSLMLGRPSTAPKNPLEYYGYDLFNVIKRYEPNSTKVNPKITSDDVSNMLLSKGVLGSKYIDKSAGAKNYVVFDPNTIKILERNGLLFE